MTHIRLAVQVDRYRPTAEYPHRTPFVQHLYVSKLLLLGMAYQAENEKASVPEVCKFRRLLFGGKSLVKQIRYVGLGLASRR
ncbi:hypothetical protein pipiens_006530 [Culex pipiens pipiens]|uniref:Uncharacterized protein n=1 Tax=Culex pipiens pipiens TaxID=38569 RepID=A0ABD1DT64_CULPP